MVGLARGERLGADEVAALMALRQLPGKGDAACLQWLSRHGTATRAVEVLAEDGRCVDLAAARQLLARCGDAGIEVIAVHDPRYPEALRQIADPPACLYLRGRAELLARAGVGIVGSRRCTPYGREVATTMARELAGRGLCVVSGLALGIDAAAHAGALEAGETVAVLGNGVDLCYPAANRRLFDAVATAGALVAELPPGTGPAAASFPRRNRIISGLSLGVVVVEAPERSGALITARTAREQGRAVFAVPGQVTNPRCAGCLALLRDGAPPARHAGDVVADLWPQLPAAVRGSVVAVVAGGQGESRDGGDPLLELLLGGARPVDALARDSGLSAAAVLERLLRLELDGFVEALPGGRYARRPG